MPRSLTVGPSPGLEAAILIQGVVEVLCGPGCVEPLDLDIVAVQQLPCRTGSATRGIANLVKKDYRVCVVDEGDVVA